MNKNIIRLLLASAFLSTSVIVNVSNAQILSDDLSEGAILPLRIGVNGEVAKVMVEPGDKVKKGQALLSLNLERYQSGLNAANAELKSAKFRLQLQKDDFDRQTELYEEGSLSTVELQQFELALKETESIVAHSLAKYHAANRDLSNAQIVAPMDGEIVAVPIVGQRVNIENGQNILIKMK